MLPKPCWQFASTLVSSPHFDLIQTIVGIQISQTVRFRGVRGGQAGNLGWLSSIRKIVIEIYIKA